MCIMSTIKKKELSGANDAMNNHSCGKGIILSIDLKIQNFETLHF